MTLGALDPIVMGTEPLRRLADAIRIVAEVSAGPGVPLHRPRARGGGAPDARRADGGPGGPHDLLVVDIGGGSSELVEIGPGRLARAAGVQVGAGRLTRRIVDRDPPTATSSPPLTEAADDAFDWTPSRPPAEVVFVGGTALEPPEAAPTRRGTRIGDDRLDRAALDAAGGIVAPSRRRCSRRPMACARPDPAPRRRRRDHRDDPRRVGVTSGAGRRHRDPRRGDHRRGPGGRGLARRLESSPTAGSPERPTSSPDARYALRDAISAVAGKRSGRPDRGRRQSADRPDRSSEPSARPGQQARVRGGLVVMPRLGRSRGRSPDGRRDRPESRLESAGRRRGRRAPARAPAGTAIPATPRHGPPTVRRSRATSFSRLTR